MCIVCGPGGVRLLQSIGSRYGDGAARARARFVAEEIMPAVAPPLDPADHDDLKGSADVILRGGPILTMRGRRDIAEAVAVRAGRIQGVGSAETVLGFRGRLTRMIDLDGRALLPGFVVADWRPPLSLLCDWLEVDATPAAALASAVGERSDAWLVLRMRDRDGDCEKAAMVAEASRPAVIVDQAGTISAASPAAARYSPDLDPARLRRTRSQPRPHVSHLLPAFLAGSRDPLRDRLAAVNADLVSMRESLARYDAKSGKGADDVIAAVGRLRVNLEAASTETDRIARATNPRSPGLLVTYARIAVVRDNAAKVSRLCDDIVNANGYVTSLFKAISTDPEAGRAR